MSDEKYKHWHYEVDSDQILWLWLDREGTAVNSLSREVFDEFENVIGDIVNENPKAVILGSAKSSGFIAGADVSQFSHLKTTDEAYELIRQAQIVLDKFEALPMPTVAMISGFCLGGGCELALACTYRVAEDIPSTRIGLPEVNLGIHPGWGGTVRLPKLIGTPLAMGVILQGRAEAAKKAEKIGMVDAAVPPREFKRAARSFALKKPKPHQPKGIACISNSIVMRPILGNIMLRKLYGKVREAHYPAPFAVVKNWMKEGVSKKAYITEAKSIAKMLVTETSRNLVRVFFLQNRMKALAKVSDFKPRHVHVIGAGTMGGDIAAWCAYKGMHVTLQDQSPERIAPAIKRAYKLYQKKLRKPRLIQAVMDRLQPDIEGVGVQKADIVIEAIFEDLKVKQELFAKLEPQMKPDAILASNTSSIPLDELCTVLKDPSRLVGVHFFNPVAKMQLVEVVHGSKTSTDVVNRALAFVGRISRLPLPVTATPGFLVNRVLMPYLMEAMKLYEEGVSPQTIDKAALDFGMPMGPITLADKVGLDICLSVAKILTQYFGGEIPQKLAQMVAEGNLGIKSGSGFYRYSKGKKLSQNDESQSKGSTQDITDRMILVMANEAVTCLQEKVVDDSDLLDVGMIFGTGFAPFRGGPVNYAKHRGVQQVVDKLKELQQRYGDRFAPAQGWSALLTNGSGGHVAQSVKNGNSDSSSKDAEQRSGDST